MKLEEESQGLTQKIAHKVVDQEDFVDDDEEYQRILEKILKESELEAKKLESFQKGENIFEVPLDDAGGLSDFHYAEEEDFERE